MRLGVFALLFCSAVAWAKGAPEPPGTLALNALTAGAEVFIDGEKVGETPLTKPVRLAPGEHTIKVQKVGYAPLIDVFKIARYGQTRLDVELQPIAGALRVTSNVERARVFVDGKFVCEAPCATELVVGPRAIQVSKGGYRDFFQNVSAVAGQELAVEARLEELPIGINPYKPPPPPPARWYEKWWVWTLTVAGAAAVTAAVVVPLTLSQRDLVQDFHPQYTYTIGK
jgi:hypothetical protein